MIKQLELVDVEAIRRAHFTVALDAVNSVGGVIIPKLLGQLGVTQVTLLNCEPTGDFAHNPEPLKENLSEIRNLMRKGRHDIGFVVDPDATASPWFAKTVPCSVKKTPSWPWQTMCSNTRPVTP